MLPLFLLLIVGLPLVESNVTNVTNVTTAFQERWTYNVTCAECDTQNTFNCPHIRTCLYHIRRCLTIAARVSPRLLLVYKNCTWNCSFVYKVEEPPETPRRAPPVNQFYYARCCNGVKCNTGGPTNIDKDIFPPEALEEELLPESAHLGEPEIFLGIASIIISNAMT